MEKTFFIGGQAVVTRDENNKLRFLQFLADDEQTAVMDEGGQSRGQLMMMRNGNFDFVANKPRVKACSELIRMAAHGRLSGTRDQAFQLTLKCFVSEDIDWQRAFVTETVDIMKDLMGPERMVEILQKLMVELKKEQDDEKGL